MSQHSFESSQGYTVCCSRQAWAIGCLHTTNSINVNCIRATVGYGKHFCSKRCFHRMYCHAKPWEDKVPLGPGTAMRLHSTEQVKRHDPWQGTAITSSQCSGFSSCWCKLGRKNEVCEKTAHCSSRVIWTASDEACGLCRARGPRSPVSEDR